MQLEKSPLKVYHRQPQAPPTTELSSSLEDSCPNDLPIALRKGKRLYTPYPISNSVSLASLICLIFVFHISKSCAQAMQYSGWKQSMDGQMVALQLNHTWELTSLPPRKQATGYRSVYTIKYHPDETIKKLKALLVPMARLNSIQILISLTVSYC